MQKLKRLSLRRFKSPLRSSQENLQSVTLPHLSSDNSWTGVSATDQTDQKLRAVGSSKTISKESGMGQPGNLFSTIEIPSQAESNQLGAIKFGSATAGRCNDPLVEDCAMTESVGNFTAGAELAVLQITDRCDPSMSPDKTGPTGVAIENARTGVEQQEQMARF